tara:strand:- start:17401 stop:18165 length:765 start_codon:yes stop_codon:yes gene_type:complete
MLLSAGCSFVWGDELPGHDDSPPSHREHTFTHKLGQSLGVQSVNLGTCGGGNDKIFRDVIDYLSNPLIPNPTHVVVLWSSFQRNEVVEDVTDNEITVLNIKRELNFTQFSPERIDNIRDDFNAKILEAYYGIGHDGRKDIIHTITKMKSMQLICDGLGIKLCQGTFHKRSWSNIVTVMARGNKDHKGSGSLDICTWIKNGIGELSDSSRLGLGKHIDLYTVAIDNDDLQEHAHPGALSNDIYSDILLDIFTEMD